MSNAPTLKDFIADWHNNKLELLIESNEYINDTYSFDKFVDTSWNGEYSYIKSNILKLNYDDSSWFGREVYEEVWKIFLDYYLLPDTNHWFVVCRNMFYKTFDQNGYDIVSFLVDYADSSQKCNWKPWRNSYQAYWKSDFRGNYIDDTPVEIKLETTETPVIPIINTLSTREYDIQLSSDSNFSEIEINEIKSGYDILLDSILDEKQYFIRVAEKFKDGTISEYITKKLNVSFSVDGDKYGLDFNLPKTMLPNYDKEIVITQSLGSEDILRFSVLSGMTSYYAGFYKKGNLRGSQYEWNKIDDPKILFTSYNEMGMGNSQWYLYDNPSYYESYAAIFAQSNYNWQSSYLTPAKADGYYFATEYNVWSKGKVTTDSYSYSSPISSDLKWKINNGEYNTNITDNKFLLNLPKSIIPFKISVSQKTTLNSYIEKEKSVYVNNIEPPLVSVNTDVISAVVCNWSSGNTPVPSNYVNGDFENVSYWTSDTNEMTFFYEKASSSYPCYFVCVYLEKGKQITLTIRTYNASGYENSYVYPCVYAPGGRTILGYGYNDYYGSYTFTPDETGYYALGCYDESWSYGGGGYFDYKFNLSIKPIKTEMKYPFKGTGTFRYRVDADIDNNIWQNETKNTSITLDYSGNNIYDIANLNIPEGSFVTLFNPTNGYYYKWNGISFEEEQTQQEVILTQHKIEVQEKDQSNSWSNSGSMLFVIEKNKSQQTEKYVLVPSGYYVLLFDEENKIECLWNGKNLLPNAQTNLIMDSE